MIIQYDVSTDNQLLINSGTASTIESKYRNGPQPREGGTLKISRFRFTC